MVKGLNALHFGIEINSSYKINRMLRMEAYASRGEWKWTNDVDATIYNPETMRPIQKVQIYSKGLHVGDAPQTQLGAILNIEFPKGFSGHIDWNYNDRIWADFEPVTRKHPKFREDSYRIPAYQTLNAGASWRGNAGKIGVSLFFNINNITDSLYIERSRDGYTHDKASFTGYWGNGRNFNFGIRLSI